MEIVYIETTIVSYLVANPSRDVVTAGQQQTTRNWWNRRRDLFQCVTSDETLAEAARGDAAQARLRLAVLAGLPVLSITTEAENLAAEFLRTGALPPPRAPTRCISPSPPWRGRLPAHLELPAPGQRPNPAPPGTRSRPARLDAADGLHSVGTDGRLDA